MTEKTIKPHRNNVLLRPFRVEEKSAGGLFVPECFRRLSQRGEVISVGSLVTKVKAGQVCFRIQGAGLQMEEGGTTYFLLPENEILAIE